METLETSRNHAVHAKPVREGLGSHAKPVREGLGTHAMPVREGLGTAATPSQFVTTVIKRKHYGTGLLTMPTSNTTLCQRPLDLPNPQCFPTGPH